jgi:hypothetical protein
MRFLRWCWNMLLYDDPHRDCFAAAECGQYGDERCRAWRP